MDSPGQTETVPRSGSGLLYLLVFVGEARIQPAPALKGASFSLEGFSHVVVNPLSLWAPWSPHWV